MRAGRTEDTANAAVALTDRALAWYRGPFLADADCPGARPLEQRLARRLARQLTSEANVLAEHKRWEQAAARYERALTIEQSEEVARALMRARAQARGEPLGV